MSQPAPSDVHVDAALSNISIAYKNSGYIADQIFPTVSVNKQSDKYYIWTKDFWFRNHVQRRAPGDDVPWAGMEISNTSYYSELFHLGFPLFDEVEANADPAADPEKAASEWLADQFLLNHEAKWVADFFTTSVWDNDVTGGTNFTKWSDYIDSNPIDDIKTGKQTIQKNTGQVPNTLVIGQEVFDTLSEHPLLLEKYKYTSVPILDNAQIAAALKVDQILVGSAIDNSAIEGATFSGEYMWGKNALLLHKNPAAPGLMVPQCGYTFVWNVYGGELSVRIENHRIDLRKMNLLQGFHSFDQKATATDLGYFFSAAVA